MCAGLGRIWPGCSLPALLAGTLALRRRKSPTRFPCHPPVQVGALSCLRQLTFVETGLRPEEFAPLAQLHSCLTALSFDEPDCLPDCLGQLTALRSLGEWHCCTLCLLCACMVRA